MSRTAAKVTQADVARAIRAAKQAGAGYVEILPDGSIRISLSPSSPVRIVSAPRTTPICARRCLTPARRG